MNRFNSQRGRGLLLVLISYAGMPFAAMADIVTDWNERAFVTMSGARVGGGAAQARTMAMVHKAMFDAITASEQARTNSVSPETAAHAAAHRILADMYPAQLTAIDAAYDTALAKLPNSTAKSAGIEVGEKAASTLLTERKTDGFFAPDTYRPAASPGSYITTSLPAMANVAGVKPFVLESFSLFRPGPPPKLDSALWARDYNEVKELGGKASTKRTAWQSETARFWETTGSNAWNQAARALLASKPMPLTDSACLFMNLNVAMFDALLTVFDAKYEYGFWRPITAIRNGDRDGNDGTERDAGWLPAIDTPMHPEYPCAHCVQDGAAGVVMKAMFGSGPVQEFTLTYAAMPGVMRKYSTIQQLEDEVSMARIWGGVHYRTSTEVGYEMGKRVGDYVLNNYLLQIVSQIELQGSETLSGKPASFRPRR